jgi:aspartate aminotransferase
MSPRLSDYYKQREPSSIRKAQILFSSRLDLSEIDVINLAIGNISLPMHPAMITKAKNLLGNSSPFKNGVVRYSSSEGTIGCIEAIIKSISAELSIDISKTVNCVITDGGSQAMELMLLGICDPLSDDSILFIDPLYTNYNEFAKRLSISSSSYYRSIDDGGNFSEIDILELRKHVKKENPNGILIIPSDNPTGQQISKKSIIEISKLCVENDIWLISDEAYRNIYYTKFGPTSIWDISDEDAPGIMGRRISIESVSKVWNACGLRIGALVTDNEIMYKKVRSEYTANLCANVIGQYIFSAVAKLSSTEIIMWYESQRKYYSKIIDDLINGLEEMVPGLIISKPQAAIYIVLDFKNIVPKSFIISDFIEFCACYGKCDIDNKMYTLLLAPMTGFYAQSKAGNKQARIALVESEYKMKLVPKLLSKLLNDFNLTELS